MSTPQPPAQQDPPGPPHPGYTSPIPVVRSRFRHVLASEWTKITSVRSTMWTLGVFVFLVVGTGLVVAATEPDLGGGNPLSMGFFGLLLATMCVITLGVLTTASEYGTGLIRTTTVVCPARGRVLAAKAVTFFLIALAVTLVSTTLVALLHAAVLGGDNTREPDGGDWLKATVGISLYTALLGTLSLAVGSILRHSAGAITLMIGVVLAPLVIAMFMFAPSLEGVRTVLVAYSIPNQLSVFYTNSLSASGPSGWDPLWIVLGLTAVAFGAAFVLLERRDVR